jgi:hypothetical protein
MPAYECHSNTARRPEDEKPVVSLPQNIPRSRLVRLLFAFNVANDMLTYSRVLMSQILRS